nr:aldo/keto reductase [uncultured Actinomyces sp.]
MYRNEAGVGAALRGAEADGVARDDVFLVTKTLGAGQAETTKSFEDSLRALNTDYVDLLLIHWPMGDEVGAWRALEKAYAGGKARAIGLSNFFGREFREVVRAAEIPPAVNQVELHPYFQQRALRPLLDDAGCQVEAWSPLAAGEAGLLHDPVLTRIATAHNATPAQVTVRFLLDEGVVVIPKSTHRERMAENLASLDVVLTDSDREKIRALDTGHSVIGWPAHPERDYDPAQYPGAAHSA